MTLFKNNFLIIVPCLLISFMPLFLITGPFLSDLSVVLVGIFFLINIILKKDYDFIKTKFSIIFVIFFLYLLINSTVNYYDYHTVRVSLGYLRFGLFSLGVFYFLEKKQELLKWLFYTFIFCFIILIFDGFYQYIFKYNIFNIQADPGGRVSSLFGSELVLGSYLSRLYPILLGLTFYLFKTKKKIILLVTFLFILTEILIFLSGERSAFFLNTLAAIFVTLMVRDFKFIRFVSLTLSIILIFLITIYDDTAKKRIWDSTIDQMGINSKKINLFSVVHESHYLSAYKMFLDKKFLGIGVRNFRNFCSQPEYFGEHERSCSTHPHNTYVQILAETGLIGFAFIILIFFYFIFKCVLHFKGAIFQKKYYFNDFEICLLAAILITIWPFVPSGNFFNNWISIIYYFPVGFLLWSLKKSDQKRRNLSLTIKQK